MDPNANETPQQPTGDVPEPVVIQPQAPTDPAIPPQQQSPDETSMQPPSEVPQEPQIVQPVTVTPEVVPTQPTNIAPTQPAPQTGAQGDDPGKTLAIVSIVLAFFFTLAGLIVALIARSKSKKAGYKNTLATVGIILNSVFLVLSIIATFFVLSLALPAIRARAVATNFSTAIRQGDVDKALEYAEVESTDKDSIKAYFLALSKAIGDSQQEVDSANVDDTKVLIYSVTNGTSKYYKVVVKGDKVINASTSDTQLSADTSQPDEIVDPQ